MLGGWVLRGARAVLAGTALVALSACGDTVPGPPQGPYASPVPSGAQATIAHGCANKHEGPDATDVGFVQSAMLRQQAQLQRVSDDLTGAVPGGNLAHDTHLAATNAHDIADLVDRSALCQPFKQQLLQAARDLVAADDALAQSQGGDDAALQKSLAAYQALKAITDNPPRPGASPSP